MTLDSPWLHRGWRWLALALIATALVYWPGLYGGWLFDDYPNIVDNHGVQPTTGDLHALISAALSSPASDFKRPLASLSFAANYLAAGLDPFWMKLTNLVIHLLNGVLVYLLSSRLRRATQPNSVSLSRDWVAALIAGGWMLLPINLTSVLYVVQRMESMANVFVLLGLLGYVTGRLRMRSTEGNGVALALCFVSVTVPTALGLLAKETAVMLPLYAFLIEWLVFGFRSNDGRTDSRIAGLFMAVLLLPAIAGLAWLAPGILRPDTWATRDFTLKTRLLTECRVVLDYVVWTLVPTPMGLSFYHDDYVVSKGLFSPWTTFASLCGLLVLIVAVWVLRRSRPLASLGLALFLGCQLLTATILPLELVYEHRNYFASFGLLLALSALVLPATHYAATHGDMSTEQVRASRLSLPRVAQLVCVGLLLWWISLTAYTAQAWGNPLHLSQELAWRGPNSPRAQYELGRTYIIYSHYDPNSVFTQLAYPPLEKAATLPGSSILPQQALIFMNSRMHRPLKDAWWDSMIEKLKARKAGVQDESSLGALTDCQRDKQCSLPLDRLSEAYQAALAHPDPSARLLAMYGNYAWNELGHHSEGERMMEKAIAKAPAEPAYRMTRIRMLLALDRNQEANAQLKQLETINIGGHLDTEIEDLRAKIASGSSADHVMDAK